MAQNFYRKIKTLRHPHILRYLDGIESKDMLIIVTDRVIPLKSFVKLNIQTEKKTSTQNMMVAWGFQCLLQALKFVNADCKLLHDAIASDSIFVTLGGDFKLAGFFITSEVDANRRSPSDIFCRNKDIISNDYQPPERRKGDLSLICQTSLVSDVYGLGCILSECFEPDTASLSMIEKSKHIPPLLRKVFSSMMSEHPGKRPSAAQIYESKGFQKAFSNKYVKTLLFLSEIQIKNDLEKLDFLKELDRNVADFPSNAAFYKIIPAMNDMLNFWSHLPKKNTENEFDVSHSALIISIIVKICKNRKELSQHKEILLPIITTLFNCNDRQTRILLLENLNLYANFIDDKLLNKKLFPKIVAGLGDNTVALKEITLKSMVTLAPKLSKSNLNDNLVKAIIRLLDDNEPSLVTNAVICFSKLLPEFNDKTRKKVISGVFPKALKAKYEHTRLAGLRGIKSAIDIEDKSSDKVSDDEINSAKLFVSKLIPAISFSLLDSSSTVRKEAFITLRFVVDKIEAVSNRLNEPNQATSSDKSVEIGTTDYFSAASKWATSLTRATSSSSPEETNGVTSTISIEKKDTLENKPTSLDSDSQSENLFDDDSDSEFVNKRTTLESKFIAKTAQSKIPTSSLKLKKQSSSGPKMNKKSATEVAKQLLEEDDFFSNF